PQLRHQIKRCAIHRHVAEVLQPVHHVEEGEHTDGDDEDGKHLTVDVAVENLEAHSQKTLLDSPSLCHASRSRRARRRQSAAVTSVLRTTRAITVAARSISPGVCAAEPLARSRHASGGQAGGTMMFT